MKIKDTLDLCGWGLHNFCIQNHDDLETLQNLGLGRKIFYTGNSNDKHHREVIYDGSTWRISAYMSDVEGVQSNLSALTDRVNAFLDGEVNSNEVLDNLKEIQAFLDAYPEATSLVQILDTKLDTAGGTITGVLTAKSAVSVYGRFSIYGLQEYRTTENHEVFLANNYYTGSGDGKGLAIYTNSHWYDLLHQGNFANLIGDTYLKTDGSNTMTNGLQLYTLGSGSINVPLTDGVFIYRGPSTGGVDVGLPDSYTNVLNIGGSNAYSNLQLAWFRSSDELKLYARVGESKGYGAWKEILHEGNYSDLITTLNGSLSVGGNVTAVGGAFSVVSIGNNTTDGTELLRFKTDRPWVFKQIGEEAATGLVLAPTTTSKMFYISEPTGEARFTFAVNGASSSLSVNGDFYVTKHAYFNDVVTCDKSVIAKELIIDGIKLSVENGLLKIEGSAFATGELAAGGAGTEGEGGAGGFSLYESWGTSAPTEPLALGANLGYELKTRVEDLELAKTKVTFEPALVSGKQIGAITIDGNKTNLFAPATYAWSEITGTENVLTTAGGVISGGTGAFTIKRDSDAGAVIRFDNTKGLLGYLGVAADGKPIFLNKDGSDRILLHQGNYSEYALPLSGGKIEGTDNYPLIIKSGTTEYSGIRFMTSEGNFITFGYKYRETETIPTMFFTDRNAWDKEFYLLHSGNVGEYATLSYGIVGANYAKGNWHGYSYGTEEHGYGVTGGVMSAGTNANGFQINGMIDGSKLVFRGYNASGFTDWKTIAFTDSDITGNAATATVAESARTLLSAENFKLFYTYPNINTWSLGYPTHHGNLDFETFSFRYGSNYNTAMLINSSGNVTIGNQDYAGTSTKLYVDNTAGNNSLGLHVVGITSNSQAMGSRTGWTACIGRTTYGLLIGSKTDDGTSLLQVGDIDGTRVLNMSLNPFGGNILIGGNIDNGSGAKLQVNGDVSASVLKLYEIKSKTRLTQLTQGGVGRIYVYDETNDADKDLWLGSSGALVVKGNGNVLIGTTNDNGAELQVAGSSTILGALSASTSFDLNRDGDNGNIFNSERAAFEIETFAKIVRFRTFNPNVNDVLTFYGSQGNVGIGKIAYTHKLEVEGNARIIGGLIVDNDLYANILNVASTSAFYGSTTFNAQSVFNAPVIIKDKNTLQIGDAVLMWDKEKKVLTVDKSFASQGEISAGGTGTEGGNTGGGGGTGTITNPYVVNFTPSQETSHSFYHNLPYYDVVVQVYEKNAISGAWDMILADVTIANESRLVTVDFGRKENVEHKIVVR